MDDPLPDDIVELPAETPPKQKKTTSPTEAPKVEKPRSALPAHDAESMANNGGAQGDKKRGYTKDEGESTIGCFGKWRKNFKWSKFGGESNAKQSAEDWLTHMRANPPEEAGAAASGDGKKARGSNEHKDGVAKKDKKEKPAKKEKMDPRDKQKMIEEEVAKFSGPPGKPTEGETWLAFSQRRMKELKEAHVSGGIPVMMKICSKEWKC